MVKAKGGKFHAEATAKYRHGISNTETTLVIDNNQPLYNQKWAIFKNYCRKMNKGKFDRNLAKKGFRHLTTQANRVYKRDYGSELPLSDRRIAENELVKDFHSTVRDEGGCSNILKRK